MFLPLITEHFYAYRTQTMFASKLFQLLLIGPTHLFLQLNRDVEPRPTFQSKLCMFFLLKALELD